MDNYKNKIEEMNKESKENLKEIQEKIDELGQKMQEELKKELKTFPDRIKKEIEKLKNDGEIPEIINVSNDMNFVYMVPSKSLSEEEQIESNNNERNRAINTLESSLKKVENAYNIIFDEKLLPENETKERLLETLPSLTFRYKYDIEKVSCSNNTVLELATQITAYKNYRSEFELDIKQNEKTIEALENMEAARKTRDTIDMAFSIKNSTEKEEKLIQEILHGNSRITIADAMGHTKDRTDNQLEGNDR